MFGPTDQEGAADASNGARPIARKGEKNITAVEGKNERQTKNKQKNKEWMAESQIDSEQRGISRRVGKPLDKAKRAILHVFQTRTRA